LRALISKLEADHANALSANKQLYENSMQRYQEVIYFYISCKCRDYVLVSLQVLNEMKSQTETMNLVIIEQQDQASNCSFVLNCHGFHVPAL
jgi:hypothetical protein